MRGVSNKHCLLTFFIFIWPNCPFSLNEDYVGLLSECDVFSFYLYVFQQQVEQMREMGITDENVARQALLATNGDMQAAINLIFSGDL